jgi:hypothetical protein
VCNSNEAYDFLVDFTVRHQARHPSLPFCVHLAICGSDMVNFLDAEPCESLSSVSFPSPLFRSKHVLDKNYSNLHVRHVFTLQLTDTKGPLQFKKKGSIIN